MIEAPPPTSLSAPTTTPALIRPSTIDGPERAGVVVDEALVHDRGALGEVGAEPHPVAVGDADAGGDDVVDHPRELVDAEHGDVADRRAQPVGVEPGRLDRSGAGPGHVGEQPEDAGPGSRRAGAISRWESRCSRS